MHSKDPIADILAESKRHEEERDKEAQIEAQRRKEAEGEHEDVGVEL